MQFESTASTWLGFVDTHAGRELRFEIEVFSVSPWNSETLAQLRAEVGP